MKIDVSHGEVLDKYSILQIKAERMSGAALEHVLKELDSLQEAVNSIFQLVPSTELLHTKFNALKSTNLKLWEVEDLLRKHEKQGTFGNDFIELAREVYFTNDHRAALKKEINLMTGSFIVEEKSYEDYSSKD